MSTAAAAALVASALLAVLTAFQVALAVGAPWGRAAAGEGRAGGRAVSVVLNAISRSRVERALWVPVAAVLLLATLVLAAAPPA